MIYCFRAFHTEKNVISVSHEKNGNFLFFQLINGAKVKKSLHITSHFRRKFLRLSFFPFSFPLMRFNVCTSFFCRIFFFSLFRRWKTKCLERNSNHVTKSRKGSKRRTTFYPCHFYTRWCLHMSKQRETEQNVYEASIKNIMRV